MYRVIMRKAHSRSGRNKVRTHFNVPDCPQMTCKVSFILIYLTDNPDIVHT